MMTGKEPRTDFVPVAIVAVQPAWLVANAASPFKTFGEVVKHAKDNPGKLTFGSPGVGSEFASRRRGGGELGRHPAGACAVPRRRGGDPGAARPADRSRLAHHRHGRRARCKQGTLRAFAVSSPQRIADFPEVPTFGELGHPGATMLPWWGLMAPSGTPQAMVARLTEELEAATKDRPCASG